MPFHLMNRVSTFTNGKRDSFETLNNNVPMQAACCYSGLHVFFPDQAGDDAKYIRACLWKKIEGIFLINGVLHGSGLYQILKLLF